MIHPELISMREFAEDWLGVKVESLYARRTRKGGSLPPVVSIGRRKYFRRSQVMEWLDDQQKRQRVAV
jgi:predicted DNA-binding transcriptional regulator AlpA